MDVAVYLRFVLALCLVLGLILGLMWLMRRFGPAALGGIEGGRRRLKVVEALQIDPKHRLVLVRRDDREHLLLVGGNTLVVESGIDRGQQGQSVGVSPGSGDAS